MNVSELNSANNLTFTLLNGNLSVNIVDKVIILDALRLISE